MLTVFLFYRAQIRKDSSHKRSSISAIAITLTELFNRSIQNRNRMTQIIAVRNFNHRSSHDLRIMLVFCFYSF